MRLFGTNGRNLKTSLDNQKKWFLFQNQWVYCQKKKKMEDNWPFFKCLALLKVSIFLLRKDFLKRRKYYLSVLKRLFGRPVSASRSNMHLSLLQLVVPRINFCSLLSNSIRAEQQLLPDILFWIMGWKDFWKSTCTYSAIPI